MYDDAADGYDYDEEDDDDDEEEDEEDDEEDDIIKNMGNVDVSEKKK